MEVMHCSFHVGTELGDDPRMEEGDEIVQADCSCQMIVAMKDELEGDER
jgi:hypothetical protein